MRCRTRTATPAGVCPPWRSRSSWPLNVSLTDSMICRSGLKNQAPARSGSPRRAGRSSTSPAASRSYGRLVLWAQPRVGGEFETLLAQAGATLLRPARKGEAPRAGARFFKPLRQIIESVNDTFKGQLDLERHGGHTPGGVAVRVLQRILALTAAIWHNDHTGQPVKRSLVAYDH